MSDSEPIREALRDAGVHIEKREIGEYTRIAGSGLGGMAGLLLARAGALGPVGTMVALLGGSILGKLVVTHRVTLQTPPPAPDGPESPMAYSDRR